MIGTEFPDIRYITSLPRELTHPPVADLEEVLASETPFVMGMKLHVWLDELRESLIAPEVYAAVIPHAEGFAPTLLKFIEDEMLADFYDGRIWSSCFDRILPEELSFTTEERILKWHNRIQWTLAARPSWLLWAQSYRGPAFGVSANTLYLWSYLLPYFKQQPIFQNHLKTLLAQIVQEMR